MRPSTRNYKWTVEVLDESGTILMTDQHLAASREVPRKAFVDRLNETKAAVPPGARSIKITKTGKAPDVPGASTMLETDPTQKVKPPMFEVTLPYDEHLPREDRIVWRIREIHPEQATSYLQDMRKASVAGGTSDRSRMPPRSARPTSAPRPRPCSARPRSTADGSRCAAPP